MIKTLLVCAIIFISGAAFSYIVIDTVNKFEALVEKINRVD